MADKIPRWSVDVVATGPESVDFVSYIIKEYVRERKKREEGDIMKR